MNNKVTINTYLSTNELKRNKINEESEQKQTHRYREHFDGYQVGWIGRMGEKAEEVNKSNWLLQNSHGDMKYNIWNIVNILITMHSVR